MTAQDQLAEREALPPKWLTAAKRRIASTRFAVGSDMHLLEMATRDYEEARAALSAREAPAQPTAEDYEEVLSDHRRLVRELDVLLNGEAGAAKQASLCDIVAQVRREGIRSAPAREGWQQIASAPKDGTTIILSDKNWIIAGYWAGAGGGPGLDTADADFPWLFLDHASGGLNAFPANRPTHWMPLPKPPVAASPQAPTTEGSEK